MIGHVEPATSMRYAFALVVTGFAGLAYALMRPLAPDIFLLLFPAVVLSAWYGGLGPGIVSSMLSVAIADLLFYAPFGELSFEVGPDTVELVVFLAVALLVSSTVESLRRARREALAASRREAVLSEVTATLSGSADYEEAFRDLARVLVLHMADYAIAYAVEDGDAMRRIGVAHADPSREALVHELLDLRPPSFDSEHGVGSVARTGEPVLAPEITEAMLHAASEGDDAHRRILLALRPVSSVIVPLRARGRTVGVLAVATTTRSDRRYDRGDLALTREIGAKAALVLDNARLLRDAQGELRERRAAEAELRARSRELEAATTELTNAVKLREDVLAVVSHDLRNLLSNLVVATHLLLELDPPPEKRRDLLARGLRVLDEADRLISDLLDVSRAEAGKLEVRPRPSPAEQLLLDAVAAFEDQARRSDVELEGAAPEGLPAALVDPDRTRRVLYNLISNAIKYSRAGGRVEVGCALEAERGLIFSVADAGRGIAPDERPHLFEPFWRSGRARRDGTGLGLAIARTLVEAQGGRIWLEATSEHGSTFCFSVPTVGEGGGSYDEDDGLPADEEGELPADEDDGTLRSGHEDGALRSDD